MSAGLCLWLTSAPLLCTVNSIIFIMIKKKIPVKEIYPQELPKSVLKFPRMHTPTLWELLLLLLHTEVLLIKAK